MTRPLPHPEQTALLEARGATLHWDVLADAPPVAEIHDAALAADWLWEIYGERGADVVLAGGTPDGHGDTQAAARVLAYLGWAKAWWPASAVAQVPALDPALLAAEVAVATAAVDHLLDDEDATERALAAATDAVHPLATLAAGPEFGATATDLLARLTDLAEDHGIVLPQPVPATPPRSAYALAAGGTTAGEPVLSRGSAAVDWALVPQGVVDAAAEATWAIVRRGGESVLEVSVPTAPSAPATTLAARFGPVELTVDEPTDTAITGRAPLPASVLLLPAARRRLVVYAPDFAGPDSVDDPAAPTRRAALVAMARARRTDPTATLTERAARG